MSWHWDPWGCLCKGRGLTRGRSEPPSWGSCSSCLLAATLALTSLQRELATRGWARCDTLPLPHSWGPGAGAWWGLSGSAPHPEMWGSLSGQGRAKQRERCSLARGREQTGLLCAADPHRLRLSQHDRDRLCQIPFHREVPDSSPTPPISGKTASSVCDAGCTSSPSPCKNPSCGMGTAPSPGARSCSAALRNPEERRAEEKRAEKL